MTKLLMKFGEAHAEKFNFDLDAMYEDIKRSEKDHIARGGNLLIHWQRHRVYRIMDTKRFALPIIL